MTIVWGILPLTLIAVGLATLQTWVAVREVRTGKAIWWLGALGVPAWNRDQRPVQFRIRLAVNWVASALFWLFAIVFITELLGFVNA